MNGDLVKLGDVGPRDANVGWTRIGNDDARRMESSRSLIDSRDDQLKVDDHKLLMGLGFGYYFLCVFFFMLYKGIIVILKENGLFPQYGENGSLPYGG